MIRAQGIHTLDDKEVIEACLERGLKVLDETIHALRSQLQEWLRISHIRTLPVPLLIYAHGFKQLDLSLKPSISTA